MSPTGLFFGEFYKGDTAGVGGGGGGQESELWGGGGSREKVTRGTAGQGCLGHQGEALAAGGGLPPLLRSTEAWYVVAWQPRTS